MAMKVTSYYHRTDPDEAGYSLGNFYEIWGACFDAAGVESVIEVGAERGRLTQELLRWAEPSGARVIAIEPAPVSDLIELIEEHPELEVVEEMSLDALGHLPIADAVVLDGDHNYYTLINELRLIAERAGAVPAAASSTTSSGLSPAATSTRRPIGSPRSTGIPTARTSRSFRGTPEPSSAGCPSSGARSRKVARGTAW